MLTPKYFRVGRLGLLILAMALSSLQAPAQPKTQTPAEAKPPAPAPELTKKKPSAGPFHGKLVAVDKVAKTITVGKRTFQITSATRIKRAGVPAVLDNAVVGEVVSGYVKPNEEGRLIATTLNLGSKASAPAKAKQK